MIVLIILVSDFNLNGVVSGDDRVVSVSVAISRWVIGHVDISVAVIVDGSLIIEVERLMHMKK